MTLQVYSARITYAGSDVLDVTRKSGTVGLFLAPTWRLLGPYLRAVEALQSERAQAAATSDARALEDLDAAAACLWHAYGLGFRREMRESYRTSRAAWAALLARERVVLVCYCTDAQRCHRGILRGEILPRLGACDRGELTAAEQGRARIVAAVEKAAARAPQKGARS